LLVLATVFSVVKTVGRAHLRAQQEDVKSELESAELRYFLENQNPVTGLIRDAAENFTATPDSNRMASMSATGFGMAVIANAATRGMVNPQYAREYVLKVLRFSLQNVPRYKGWFLHFVDWQTGERFGRSEYSSIDSALFLAGSLYAAQALHDPQIAKLNHEIYTAMDFNDLLTNGGQLPDKKTLSMAYEPEHGYSANQWGMYGEQMVLLVLGMGHPTHPLPERVWLAWERPVSTLPSGEKLVGLDSALFIHQYSQLFIDFRKFDDGLLNYWQNAALNTRYQRDLAHSESAQTFQAGFWGLSAGAAPNDGYEAWTPAHHLTTVCLDCTIGSAMYMPQEVLADAARWLNGPYHEKIWGKYGFTDSLDLDRQWIASHVYGITVGPAFLSLANTDDHTSLWKSFMAIPEIQVGLQRATSVGQRASGSQLAIGKDGRRPGSSNTP
jgi:hypothetical protein